MNNTKPNKVNKGKIKVIEMVREISIDDKSSVRVSKTMREGENVLCVDLRKFHLYPIDGHYDDVMKATPNGVTVTLDKLPAMMCALWDIYLEEFGRPFDRVEADE